MIIEEKSFKKVLEENKFLIITHVKTGKKVIFSVNVECFIWKNNKNK